MAPQAAAAAAVGGAQRICAPAGAGAPEADHGRTMEDGDELGWENELLELKMVHDCHDYGS